MGTEGLAGAEEVAQLLQGRQIAGLPFAALQRPQQLDAPGQAVAARGTPAAGFAGEKLLHVAQQTHHVDAVIHRHGEPGAHPSAHLADAGGIHLGIQVFWQQEAGAGAPRLPGLEAIAALHAACVLLEQLAGGNAEGQLPDPRIVHLAGKAHQLGAVIFRARQRQPLIPGHALAYDGRHVAQGLDVVDAGGFAPDARNGREGGLGTGVGAPPFQGVDKRRLLAADVAAGAGVNEQLEIKARAQDVVAKQPRRLGFLDGTTQMDGGIHILAAQEDVAAVGLERPGRDDHPLDEQMGQLLHQQPVFPGVGFHLVGVAEQVTDVHALVLGHQAPLHPGGKARAAAPLEAGILDGADDFIRAHLAEGLAGGLIALFGLVFVQPHRLAVVAQAPGERVGLGSARGAVGSAEGGEGLAWLKAHG